MEYIGGWVRPGVSADAIGDRLRSGLGSTAVIHRGSGRADNVVVATQPSTATAQRDGSFVVLDGDLLSDAGGGDPPELLDVLGRFLAVGHAALAEVDATAGWTIFDAEAANVTVGRDVVGNGSMFVAETSTGIFWSPRLALLQAATGISEPDWRAFDFFVANGFVPSPWTMYRGIERLGPGEVIEIDGDGMRRERYHSFIPEPSPEEQRFNVLSDELPRSVRSRVDDIARTGVLLSGGVDSQLMMAMITDQMGSPPKGFTFQYTSYDGPINEGDRARRCADHLGAEHVLIETDPLELAKRLPGYIEATAEPLARTIHTVMLDIVHDYDVDLLITGDGADSLYLKGGDRKTLAMAGFPDPIRSVVGGSAALGRAAVGKVGSASAAPVRALLDGVARAARRADIGMNTSLEPEFIKLPDRADCYLDRSLAAGSEAARVELIGGEIERLGDRELAQKLRALELRFDGADDLLRRDLDIAQLNGVRIRSPFFSTNVMNRWMNQPVPQRAALKQTHNEFTKMEVRRLAATLLPDHLANAPKLGHSIPVVDWLRGPLLPWLKEVTSPAELRRQGVFDPAGVARLLDLHLNQGRELGWGLWSIASASVWLDHVGGRGKGWID